MTHLDVEVVKRVNERSPRRMFAYQHLEKGFYSARAPPFVEGTLLDNSSVVEQCVLFTKSFPLKIP